MKKRLHHAARHFGRATVHVGRWAWYGSAVMLALLAAVFTAARLLLPLVAEKQADLEEYLSRRSGHPVRIEKLTGYWDGLHPGLHIRGLKVFAADGTRPAVRLDELRLSLALTPLLLGNVEIHSLTLTRPSLAFERLADGRFRISGFDPIQPVEAQRDEKFVGWLFRQRLLLIEDGELQWFDHRERGKAVHLTHVNLRLHNSGDHHRLGFSAAFPPEICADCSLIADITGNPFLKEKFDGEIYLRAREVNINALPLVAREHLPAALRGKFTVQLWSDWDASRPSAVHGQVAVSDLRLPFRGLWRPVAVREAATQLVWETKGGGWQLDLTRLTLGLSGPAWSAGRLRVTQQPDELELKMDHVRLDDLTGFAVGLRRSGAVNKPPVSDASSVDGGWQEELAALWRALKPRGSVDDLTVTLRGDLAAPGDYTVEAKVADFTIEPHRQVPGVSGVSGRLFLHHDRGAFTFQAADARLTLPTVFRAPLPVTRAGGRLQWEKRDDHWLVTGSDLKAVNEDGRVTAALELTLPFAAAVSPRFTLRADFRDVNGARAARYYPARHLSRDTLAWMERAFAGGTVATGHLIYDGPVREFPFREGQGKFEIRALVRDGVYRYLPGWEPVTQAEVDVAVLGTEFLITGHGMIGALAADQIVVQSQTGPGNERVVRVGGNVAGAVDETLRLLRAVRGRPEETAWQAYLPSDLQGSGAGMLGLDIVVPLDESKPTRIQGEYRFLNGGLRFAGMRSGAENITGGVRFDESGVRDGRLRARLFGGDSVVAIASPRPSEYNAVAQGRITAEGLAPLLGPRLAPHVKGAVEWNATFRLDRKRRELDAEVDLPGLKLSLPPPLHLPTGLTPEKLVVRTESSGRDTLVVALGAGRMIRGRLAFQREKTWGLKSGRILFQDAAVAASAVEPRVELPKERGLHVSARLRELDADQWLPLLGAEGTETPAVLTRLSGETGSLNLFGRPLGRLALDLRRQKAGWSGTVGGQSLSGQARFARKREHAQIELDLSRLHLPDRKRTLPDDDVDPRKLPYVSVRAKSFQVKGREFGALDFRAAPAESGWKFERVNVVRPETRFEASGRWQVIGDRPACEFNIRLTSTDIGKTMAAFGVPDQIEGGEVDITSRLAWPGRPTGPRLAVLSGRVDISAKKGRFVKLKQGAGRLFGLLDLSAIGRYLMLDFSPLFGKGFVFDRIQGGVTIERGNAYTRGFSIKGPSATIGADGRVGLAAEDFDLTLDLRPHLSDSLTLTSWALAGPQVAAVVLALQKIFKKQISEGTRVTYTIKGPWENPAVARVLKEGANSNSERPDARE
jgi:uncharacterized protein (TIGR02099 family)